MNACGRKAVCKCVSSSSICTNQEVICDPFCQIMQVLLCVKRISIFVQNKREWSSFGGCNFAAMFVVEVCAAMVKFLNLNGSVVSIAPIWLGEEIPVLLCAMATTIFWREDRHARRVPRLIYMFNSAYEAIVCFLWGCAQRWQGACLSEQLARSLSLAASHASSGGLS